MIERNAYKTILDRLAQFPAVVLLGPRQVGKTTLAEFVMQIENAMQNQAGHSLPGQDDGMLQQAVEGSLQDQAEGPSQKQAEGSTQGLPEGFSQEDAKVFSQGLAESIGSKDSIYLDLENPRDRGKLVDVNQYLDQHESKLVILDEVHRVPELFHVLRGSIDRGRRKGIRAGRFLLLGSASLELLKQAGESLAGRVALVELTPLLVSEVQPSQLDQLWVRGGFPDSFLAGSDQQSMIWRESFIKTYLERDIPDLGLRVPAETLRRFWTMLAHNQGGLLNAAQLAQSLAISGKTVARYLDLMVDLLLVRRLQSFHVNVGKRLVKSPKVYVRDSGVLHALLGIANREALFGHPIAGASWEGHVIDNLLTALGGKGLASFYRTAVGAELDLVLEFPDTQEKWALEIKMSTTPKPSRGFYNALEDVAPDRAFVVHAEDDRYPLAPLPNSAKASSVEAISLSEIHQLLADR